MLDEDYARGTDCYVEASDADVFVGGIGAVGTDAGDVCDACILNKNGKSLGDFLDVPQPDPDLLTQLDNRLIREELNYNLAELKNEHQTLYASLNPEQLNIYNQVILAVTQQAGGLFFLYGPGGTGKTFVYNTILTKLRSEKLIALAVASSELMQQVRLIIWDEAPMTQRFGFEALDKTLKDILGAKNEVNRGKLFGEMPILLGGDFRQILPVIPKGKRQEVVQACINRFDLWQHCQLHTLSRIMWVNEYTADGHVDPRKQQFNKWVLALSTKSTPDSRVCFLVPNTICVIPLASFHCLAICIQLLNPGYQVSLGLICFISNNRYQEPRFGFTGTMKETSDVKIDMFDGNDFSFWKMQIEDALYQKKLYEPLKGVK
ncbi:uncharacterized protein [Rutidosis leptorrhynchoides]|uniref:uncharacterized protein n=1 Tax=Rutidosis leptorrhynchoides TaxID=125765 RepID=UPI003A9A26DC